MAVKPKKMATTKGSASPRMSFYPYAEDMANLEQTRAELQAATPHMHVSLSDALRHAIREFRRLKDARENSGKIS